MRVEQTFIEPFSRTHQRAVHAGIKILIVGQTFCVVGWPRRKMKASRFTAQNKSRKAAVHSDTAMNGNCRLMVQSISRWTTIFALLIVTFYDKLV